MQIEIVSHCYAVDYPHYANALCYQLSSIALALYLPRCEVIPVVCLDPSDGRTRSMVDWFLLNTNLKIKAIPLPIHRLGRRAIGRNLAAKLSQADIVWFADVDQTYEDDIFSDLMNLHWPDGVSMIYPKTIKIHRDHATGDKALEKVAGVPGVLSIDKTEFIDKRYKKAIGGVQIVRGDFARKHGYLYDHPKWQKPVEDGRFARCRCDIPYRKFCWEHGKVVGVDLPGMYRLRHTKASHGRPPKL